MPDDTGDIRPEDLGAPLLSADLLLLLRLSLNDGEPSVRTERVLDEYARADVGLDEHDAADAISEIERLIGNIGAEGAANMLRSMPLRQKLNLAFRLATFFKARPELEPLQTRLAARVGALLDVGQAPSKQ